VAIEIERKFLVDDHSVVDGASGTSIAQGYLQLRNSRSVRVRVSDGAATIAVKGPPGQVSRLEIEESVSLELGLELLAASEPAVVTKMRYPLVHGAHLWTIDVFQDQNVGLMLAEIELHHPHDEFIVPNWTGREVTEDVRFFNEYLAFQPYSTWR
jgi:adenylate cyclase